MMTDRERGPLGAWLRQARTARGYSSADTAVVAVKKLTGVHIPVSQWRSYESGGRKFSTTHRQALEEVFGPAPDNAEGAGVELASAIRDLVTEVRLARVAQETSAQALAEMAGMVGRLLAHAGMQGVPGLPNGDGSPPGL